jgi:hypothetical protein
VIRGCLDAHKQMPFVPEAEHFAAVVLDMPPKVRAFFEYEAPIVSSRQGESIQESTERRLRTSFGGWCG